MHKLDKSVQLKLDAILAEVRASNMLQREDLDFELLSRSRVQTYPQVDEDLGQASVPKSRVAELIHTRNLRPSEMQHDDTVPPQSQRPSAYAVTSLRVSESGTEDLAAVPGPEDWAVSKEYPSLGSFRPSSGSGDKEPAPDEGTRELVLRQLGMGSTEVEAQGTDSMEESSQKKRSRNESKEVSIPSGEGEKDRTGIFKKAASGMFRTASRRVSSSTKDEAPRMSMTVRQRKRTQLQKQVWMFLEDPDLVQGARLYENVLSCVILVSAVMPIVPPEILDGTVNSAIGYGLFAIDCLFFLEVLLRFYGCPNRLRFFTSFYNALDILSVIIPMAMKLHLQSFTLVADAYLDVSPSELLLIVAVPVVRLLKLLRRFENSHLIQQAFAEALGALPSLLYCMMLLVFFFSSVIYVLEPRETIESMPRAIWFTMVTLSTVGYGDVVPSSPGGNVVVCVLIVVSAIYMAMPIGIVGKAFGSVWDDRHRLLLMQRLRTRFATVGYDPQDIPGLFCSYDENGDGELSMDEFRRMLQQLEVEAKDERAHDVFQAFDNDGSGAIDDSEFIKTLFPTAYKNIYTNEAAANPATTQDEDSNDQ